MKIKGKKIVVGISGGVDSSVSLALLKEKGFSPIGVFMNFWGDNNNCCGSEAERRARKTCSRIDVPFYEMDVKRRFKKEVVDYFLESYEKGITPNPCIVCNRKIKFNYLFEKAKALGASRIATGHYADIKKGKILKAKDESKDQTYFLWQLEKRNLKRIIFPLGNLEKKDVRKKSRKMKLPATDIADSQEVCFIDDDLIGFLEKYLEMKEGFIEDKEGKKIGKHNGLPAYTLGQRKGIGLSGGPFYVLEKDLKRNVLIVAKNSEDLLKSEVLFYKSNFFEKINFPMEVEAKIRYNASAGKGRIEKEGVFKFYNPQKSVTPGQSIVFYKEKRLIGGGVIKS